MKKICRDSSGWTEITEIKEWRSLARPGPAAAGETAAPWNDGPTRGWIFFDNKCRYCIAAVNRFKRLFARRGFHFLPLQTPWVQKRLELEPGARLEEMRVLTRDGQHFGGADGIIFLARHIWWTRPFWFLSKLPQMRGLVDRAYRWIAAHRGCTHLGCSQPLPPVAGVADLGAKMRLMADLPGSATPATGTDGLFSWLGLLALPPLALLTRSHVAPWIFMWLMAGAIFLGCKWLTFWRAKQRLNIRATRALSYFVLWAGMDAAQFLARSPGRPSRSVETRRIILAAVKVLLGVTLLFALARLASNPLLAGWIGMVGMVLILHFGLFDLAGMGWQMAGVDAKPIMDAPIKSSSLSEFWGRRWNGAFNQLILTIFFRRLVRSIGGVRATLTAFLISGLVHELVISLPAAAGYGLPTAYFLLQAWGVIAQRSCLGDQLRLRHGIRGRVFTMCIAAGPAFWLFHPPFVRNVVLPFLKAIQAI